MAHQELQQLYDQDQTVRSGEIDYENMVETDRQRLAHVKRILASGIELDADDLFHAAMVFQHGETSEDYQMAMILARQSWEKGSREGKELFPKAEDRYLLSLGRPQIWGTQFIQYTGKPWELRLPYDPTVKTQEERDRMGVVSIEQQLRELNQSE